MLGVAGFATALLWFARTATFSTLPLAAGVGKSALGSAEGSESESESELESESEVGSEVVVLSVAFRFFDSWACFIFSDICSNLI